MNLKLLLTKTLLVAAGLCAGVNGAWGTNYRLLCSQNYESAGATDWTCPNGTASLESGHATYGKYAKCIAITSSGSSRSCYKSVSYNYPISGGYTTAAMTTLGYNVEFDILLQSGNKTGYQSQFIVPTEGPNIATNTAYSGTDYVFALSQPELSTDARVQTWYINDLAHTGSTIILTYSDWYHVKLVVTASEVSYVITNNSTSTIVKAGSKTVDSMPSITGFWALLGRGVGEMSFDNLQIYNYSNFPELTYSWGQNFASLVTENKNMEISEENCTNGLTTTEDNYYVPSTDGVNALSDENISFYVAGTNRKWMLRTWCIYNFSSGTSNLHIKNLARGQIVKVKGNRLFGAGSNVIALTDFDENNTRYFQVTAAGTAEINTNGNYGELYSIDVYNTNSEIVGAMDKSSGFAAWVGSGIDVPKDGAVLLQFKNHGTTGQNYYNWCLGINDASDGFLCNIRADWAALDGGGVFTYPYRSSTDGGVTVVPTNWDDFQNDLQDAEVALNLTYKNGKLYITGTTTKNDNIYYFNYTYGDGSYAGDKWIVHPFVEKAWLEITSTASTTARVTPVHATKISTTLGTQGYSTFSETMYPLDLSAISGATAYYAESISAESVTFRSTEASVPVGEGLLLKGENGASVTINIADDGTSITGNKLVGCIANTDITSATDNYANFYVMVNGTPKPEFQNIKAYCDGGNTVTIPAGKAYLDATGVSAPSLNIIFDDALGGTTGIDEVNGSEVTVNGEYYNIAGQRVAQPTKGLYIVGGKKVIVK